MKFCTDCWNFDRCNAIGRVVDLSVDDGVCRDFDECKPQTNADRIRAMSDEELNDLFHDIYDSGAYDAVSYGCGHQTNSFEWTMDWLQQPAEGE